MRPTYLFFILMVCGLCSFAQEYKEPTLLDFFKKDIEELGISDLSFSSTKRTYRIWITYQQIIEISQDNDSTFDGYILNYIKKTTGKGKRERKELIIHKAQIPQNRIRKLMNDLQYQNIETLPNDDEIEGYPRGLDGTSYTFEIKTEQKHRFYSYWEPMNDRYTSEETPEVANVRNMIRLLNEEFNLWEYFSKFRDRLPPGNYSYGGIQMIKMQ